MSRRAHELTLTPGGREPPREHLTQVTSARKPPCPSAPAGTRLQPKTRPLLRPAEVYQGESWTDCTEPPAGDDE